jgi:hypothetical protein
VAAALSSLERILLACSRDATDRSSRLLLHADAICFSEAMAEHCTAPQFAFHFQAADGLMIWEDWGRPNEKIFQIGGHVDELDAYHHSVGCFVGLLRDL